jgi:ATP-dependent Lhr-like helicase
VHADLPFGPAARAWFVANFAAPTDVQARGWARIAAGEHALLVAPTGSGKTLAAFLSALDRIASEPAAERARSGYRVVYVSPLKALVADVERALRAPLAGLVRHADGDAAAEALRRVRVDVRTGDTPAKERAAQARDPGDVLVTTPESLHLVLGSRAAANLARVHTLVVDEIHALCGTKRGAHLALALERLVRRVLAAGGREPQRIGLSATARPLPEVARFLGGDRDVAVVDASAPPQVDLSIVVPVPDMERVLPPRAQPLSGVAADGLPPSGSILGQLHHAPGNRQGHERGLWPALHPLLLADVRAHRSTIVFVNNRALAERLAERLNELAGEELVLAHHGSVSHEKRAAIEERLKRGEVRGIVATSSLELGIDMGAVDLVVLVESPGSVARGLQRVGRAGHQVGATSVGRVYPKFRGDLLECAVVVQRMLRGEIEALRVPRAPLDVLAQQIVATVCDGDVAVAELERMVRRAAPYRDLSSAALASVLDMLTGRFAKAELAELRPRLAWDRTRDVLSARRGSALVARLNAGTIPDRGTYAVHLGAEGPRIGELDEEMVHESRSGDTFLLGTSTWRIEEITRDRVVVSPAPGEPGRLPFWRGDGPGRPLELGLAIGAFVRSVGERLARTPRADDEAAVAAVAPWLRRELPLDEHAAANLARLLVEQRAATGALPTDRTIVVERFRDELGDWRVCILAPFGRRVLAPWAVAIEEGLARRDGPAVQIVHTDDGIVLRFPELAGDEGLGAGGPFDVLFEALLPDPDELEDLVTQRVGRTALFAGLFRENAVRALLVTRRRPNQRNPLWAQRLKTRALLAAVQDLPDFPVVLETYRQVLGDEFDLAGLAQVLADVRRGAVRVERVDTEAPSPFARSLVFAYVAAYLYDGDSPVAEQKAQALTLDKELLRELLGSAALRDLVDPVALAELEAELAGSADGWRARDRDELHDLLRRGGERTAAEVAACVDASACRDGGAAWLAELVAARRAIELDFAGEHWFVAADDAGLYRDALGLVVPAGLPAEYLALVEAPLERLLARHARVRGPFAASAAARRYGLAPLAVEARLGELVRRGVLVHGELRPGGRGAEWCDAEVLRRLKRRTLARLRREVAAVDGASYARFLVQWHGVRVDGDPPAVRAPAALLLEALERLEGVALPWSTWQLDVLPARVPGFAPEQLDLLAASGELVWLGRGALGEKDGRVLLVRRERAAVFAAETGPPPAPGSVAALVEARLARAGACFLTELERAVRAELPGLATSDFEAALWELVWSGRVTNDTFGPLRTLGRPRTGRAGWRGVLAGGRWSLASSLGDAPAADAAVARAAALLARHGVVGRECVVAEEVPGGFGPLYRCLRALEEAGRVRRGHFVEELAGAQFALPGAVDALRAAAGAEAQRKAPRAVVLAALDPAQPYGATLPWPAAETALRRVPGALVALVGGEPLWYLAASRRQLVTFATAEAASADGERGARLGLAFAALARVPRKGRRRLELETVDGRSVFESPHLERLLASGFARDHRALAPVATPL